MTLGCKQSPRQLEETSTGNFLHQCLGCPRSLVSPAVSDGEIAWKICYVKSGLLRMRPGKVLGVWLAYWPRSERARPSDRNEMFMPGALHFPSDGRIVVNGNAQPPSGTNPESDHPYWWAPNGVLTNHSPDTQRGRDCGHAGQGPRLGRP